MLLKKQEIKEIMDARELRIGNYIKIITDTFVVTPEILVQIIQDELPTVEPIPLTDELLLDCCISYKRRQHLSPHWADCICFQFDGRFDVCHYAKDVWVCRWWGRKIRKIKYLHELQNLLFDLTEKELKIKSKKDTG